MLEARWLETFRAWAATREHQRQIEGARRIIAQGVPANPYVAYSGGKDSTVMAHLVLEQAPDSMCLHWDYGPYFIPRMVHQEIMANLRGLGATNIRVETSSEYERLGYQARNVMGREYLGKLVPRLAAEGYHSVFVGLRKEESGKRRRRIAQGKSLTAHQREHWPIADWGWMDVWAYIVSHDLPYLSLYDARAELVGYDQARFTTLFDPEFDHVSARVIDQVLHWRLRGEAMPMEMIDAHH